MLPSRGLLRSSPSLGLAKASFSKPSIRISSRQFGTALRSTSGATLQGTFTARRIARPLVLTAASQHIISSLRQARNASTQPTIPPVAPADPSTFADITATPVNLTGSDLLDIPEQIGFLKTLGLDFGWGPTAVMQTVLEHIYVYTGLPWWASICVVAVGIRMALLKPTIDASENAQKLQELQKDPRYNAATEEMKKVLITGNHLAGAEARAKIGMMNKAADYHPWKNFIQLLQLPIGIGMFRLIQGMAALPVPSLETGGLLWLTDLTTADPFFVLPIITGIVVVQSMRIPLPYMAPKQQKVLKTMSLVMLPISTVVGLFLPAGVQIYFFATSLLHLVQSFVIHSNWFRRWVGMKPLVKTFESNGIEWEAPRVVDTRAVRVKSAQPTGGAKSESMFGSFQSTIDMAKEKMNDMSDKSTLERNQKSARDYETKRALEEKEKYLARVNGKRGKNDEYR